MKWRGTKRWKEERERKGKEVEKGWSWGRRKGRRKAGSRSKIEEDE